MQTEPHAIWFSYHATLAQDNSGGANPIFDQANPGSSSQPGSTTGTPPAGGAPAGGGGGPPSIFGGMFPFIFVIGALFIFIILSNKKQERKRRELLNSVKKYDKVVTIGGIIGTVVELRDDEVVLKVDEHSSTKVRFTRSAIQSVLRPPSESDSAKDKDRDETAESKSKGESVGAKN